MKMLTVLRPSVLQLQLLRDVFSDFQSSAFRVQDEGLKVGVELRHQRIHKVFDGRLSLEHPCGTNTREQFEVLLA